MATAAVYIGIRVSPALSGRLEEIAAREHNHVSAVVRRLISAALDADEAAHGIKRPRRRPRIKRSRVA